MIELQEIESTNEEQQCNTCVSLFISISVYTCVEVFPGVFMCKWDFCVICLVSTIIATSVQIP